MVKSFCPLSGSHQSHPTFQLFDYLCHYSHCHLLSIRLGIRCLSCSITCWLSQTCCFLSAHMHSCYLCTLITHADCHMFNYCFSFHASLCKFLPFVLSAYQHSACCILFPVRTSLLLSTNVYYVLSLFFLHLCILCTLLTSCMLIQPCTLIVPCTLIAYFHSMCPCDPIHTGHFILTSCFCFLVAVWAYFLLLMVHPALYIFWPFVIQSLCGIS